MQKLGALNESLDDLHWFTETQIPVAGSDNLDRILRSLRDLDHLVLSAKLALDAAMSEERRRNAYPDLSVRIAAASGPMNTTTLKRPLTISDLMV